MPPRTPSRRVTLGPGANAAPVPSHQKLTASRRLSIDNNTNTNSNAVPPNLPPRRAGGNRQSMIPRVGGRENNGPPSTPASRPSSAAAGSNQKQTNQKSINRRRSSIGMGRGGGGGGEGGRATASSTAAPASQRKPPRQSMLVATPTQQRRGPRHSMSAAPTPVTTTRARRRSSIGLGGVDGQQQQQGGSRRQSLLPPPAGVALPATSAKEDLRPVKDKQYQKQCISRLHQFLVDRGYPNPITPKSLSRPSSKDFASIVTFMLRRIDPNFQNFGTHDGNTTVNITMTKSPAMKFEDEVCMHFKLVGYPFPLSKTALVSAGSPNSWPGLLAALTWYMEHLELLEGIQPADYLRSQQPFESIEDLETKTERAFFQYLQESYQAYMTSDENLEAEIQDDLIRRFDFDAKILDDEIDRVTEQNAAIVERMHMLEGEIGSINEYAQKKEQYTDTLKQMQDLTNELEEQKKALDKKIRSKEFTLLQTKQTLERTNESIKELKHKIETQELSVNDVTRMENESRGLTESINRLELADQKYQEELLAYEQNIRDRSNECESVISSYNRKLDEAATSSSSAPTAKKLGDLKASLNLDKLLSSGDDALGISIDNQVLVAIGQAKDEVVNATSAAEKQHEEALDNLEKSKEQLQASSTKKQIVEGKISKAEETLQDEAGANKSKIEVHQCELQILEEMVAKIRDPRASDEQKLSYERQLTELQWQQRRQREDYKLMKQELLEAIEMGCQLMMEHEQHYKNKKEELKQYWFKKEACLEDVKVPKNLGFEDGEDNET